MRKLKEVLFAIITLACVVAGGLGCVALFEKYAPDYQLLGVPMMIYTWVLAGYGAKVIDDKLKQKWDDDK